jgi:hypothetical protein
MRIKISRHVRISQPKTIAPEFSPFISPTMLIKMISLTFLLDQKSNKKVKSAGIPPHNLVRIACRRCRPQTIRSYFPKTTAPKISRYIFPTMPRKSLRTKREHFSDDVKKSPLKKCKRYTKCAHAKLLAANALGIGEVAASNTFSTRATGGKNT